MTNDAIYSALMGIKQDIGRVGAEIVSLRGEIEHDRAEHKEQVTAIILRVTATEQAVRDLQHAPAQTVQSRIRRLWGFAHDLVIAGGSGTAVYLFSHWKP